MPGATSRRRGMRRESRGTAGAETVPAYHGPLARTPTGRRERRCWRQAAMPPAARQRAAGNRLQPARPASPEQCSLLILHTIQAPHKARVAGSTDTQSLRWARTAMPSSSSVSPGTVSAVRSRLDNHNPLGSWFATEFILRSAGSYRRRLGLFNRKWGSATGMDEGVGTRIGGGAIFASIGATAVKAALGDLTPIRSLPRGPIRYYDAPLPQNGWMSYRPADAGAG